MRRNSFVALLGAAALAASCVAATAGSASASPPRWSMSVKNLPPKVASGNAMGYQVTISNAGPSNISQLYLVTQTSSSPAYVSTPSQGSCQAAGSGPLGCTFGALGAKKSVTVTVAYAGPVSGTYDPGDPVFQGNSNGLTFSDGGSSHGDTLTDPNERPTTIAVGNGNFAGGFSLDGAQINTDQTLSDSNKQATIVKPPAAAADAVVTAEDGPLVSFTCKSVCSKAYGEWSAINVNNGQVFGSFFSVTVLIRATDLPNNLGQLQLAHVLDNGSVQVLKQGCGATPQNCIQVGYTDSTQKVVQVVAWINQNGGVRVTRP